jgi:hypothetical protein
MKATNCDQVDGYLGKWLSEEERIQFEAHLSTCPDCRQWVEEGQRLESLLANAARVSVPPALVDRIEHQLRQARRRRAAAWAGGLAAAAILMCAISALFVVQRVREDRSAQPDAVAQLPQQQESAPDPRPPVQVTFEPSCDVIAVPHKTDNPSVTIIWVFPTVKMDQESTPEPSELFEHLERNGL